MRERRKSGRTVLNGADLSPNRKYFLVFEGSKTEEIYFQAVKDKCPNKLIDIIPLIRSNNEAGFSNPQKMLEMILNSIEEQRRQEYKYSTVIDWIVDYIKEQRVNLLNAVGGIKQLTTTMENFCTGIKKVELDDTIARGELEEFIEDVLENAKSELKEKLWQELTKDKIKEIIDAGNITYDEDHDKIMMVVDRDRGSFTQYGEVVKRCKKESIGLFVTNPCFEFWLLLHFDEPFKDMQKLDTEKIGRNPKVTNKKTYCYSLLCKYFSGYKKNRFDAYFLMDKICTAIKNEKLFCEDVDRLEESIGSNIGRLMEEEFGFKNAV